MAYLTGTSFAPISRGNSRNYRLVGYWLNGANGSIEGTSHEIRCRLDDRCSHQGSQLKAIECDAGSALNPIRLGLWRALRRLICESCPPKRMPMSFLSVDEFVSQALAPCTCNNAQGLDGIVFATLKHLSTDQVKGSQIIMRLAERGKHVIADDGICLSCCHPATQEMLQKKRLLVAS